VGLFGTDGVRGLANGDLLTAELALGLARSAAHEVGAGRVVIGRDTRPSGSLLAAAAAAGFASAGVEVLDLGVVPTPVVAFACASGVADLGLVVSASHNPMPDNGLKLFGPGGWKLTDAQEAAIETGLGTTWSRPTGTDVGTVGSHDLRTSYVEAVVDGLATRLRGLKVVVDCAEGAAWELAPAVYRAAGAEVVAIHATGDGSRINDGCGATHLADLQAAVVAHGADLGLAHDGDADRCLAVDATGAVVDGDQLLALLAVGRKVPTVVATVMSNLGFVRAMREHGVEVLQTAVGDRYVLAAMRAEGHVLGGEQSGHLLQLDRATTGDGIRTGVAVLEQLAETGASLRELAAVMTRLPQVLVNVRAPRDRASAAEVLTAVAAEEAALGDGGRVLLRPSGTEPLVRVMVEAETAAQAQAVAERLAAIVSRVVAD
jgi:phosphoglucosamine mutase